MGLGMGRWEVERQGTLWVATSDAPQGPRLVFYEKPNGVLAEARFDEWVEELCEPFYAQTGRKGIPPGVCVRRARRRGETSHAVHRRLRGH